jgi:hypothetical protein
MRVSVIGMPLLWGLTSLLVINHVEFRRVTSITTPLLKAWRGIRDVQPEILNALLAFVHQWITRASRRHCRTSRPCREVSSAGARQIRPSDS